MDEQLQVPIEPYIEVLEEQRNTALTQAAQMKALFIGLKAENDRLAAENEKLRADADDGPFGDS